MPRITPLLAGMLLLAAVTTARADDHCLGAESALCAAEASAGEFRTSPLRARSFGMGHASRPTALDPHQGLYASLYPMARLGFFAQSEGFALNRRTSLYDVQGGALVRIDRNVAFTASYRLLSIDLGFDSDVQAVDVEPGIAAPFIGMLFDF